MQQFIEVNPLVMAPHIPEQSVDVGETIAFSSRDKLLPDLGMLHGRLIVGAWENALDDVQDQALDLLHHAVQVSFKSGII